MVRRVTVVLAALALAACGTTEAQRPRAEESTPAPTASQATAEPSPSPLEPRSSGRPVLGSAPPPWLGTRVLPRRPDGLGEVRRTPPELVQRRFTLPDRLPALPGAGFVSRVVTPAPADVITRSTWKPGCPVGRDDLSWVRLTFHGFDDRRHTGELLVDKAAADDLVGVFQQLYAIRFPIEEMRITTKADLAAPPTGDGNDTGVFTCRPTVGSTSFSQHAYGRAIDLNPFQNPYAKGDVVLPELASSYLERDFRRPGMIASGGPVVRAFASIGWEWGGGWRSLKDYQHFSQNGR